MPGGFRWCAMNILKLENTDTNIPVPQVARKLEVPAWWFIATVLLQFAGILHTQYDRSVLRQELDDNGVLIKQLQEAAIIKALATKKRSE